MKRNVLFLWLNSLFVSPLQGSDPLLTPRTREMLNESCLEERKKIVASCKRGRSESEQKQADKVFDKIFKDRKPSEAQVVLKSGGGDHLVVDFVWNNLFDVDKTESWQVPAQRLSEKKYLELLVAVKAREKK